MWILAFRYFRPSFWFLCPVVISLYLSTVYGWYHYVTDAAVEIAVAFLAVAIAPALMALWDRIV
jgi:hypothetical protein